MKKGMHLLLSASSVPGWKMGNRFPGGTPGTGQPWGGQTWDFRLSFTSLAPQFVVSTEEARSAVSLGCHLREWWAQGNSALEEGVQFPFLTVVEEWAHLPRPGTA